MHFSSTQITIHITHITLFSEGLFWYQTTNVHLSWNILVNVNHIISSIYLRKLQDYVQYHEIFWSVYKFIFALWIVGNLNATCNHKSLTVLLESINVFNNKKSSTAIITVKTCSYTRISVSSQNTMLLMIMILKLCTYVNAPWFVTGFAKTRHALTHTMAKNVFHHQSIALYINKLTNCHNTTAISWLVCFFWGLLLRPVRRPWVLGCSLNATGWLVQAATLLKITAWLVHDVGHGFSYILWHF